MSNRYFKAEIKSNISITKEINVLTLSPLLNFQKPSPGQFYMLQTGRTTAPFLKRPFSIFRHTLSQLQFLYRIKGEGTMCLSNSKKGEIVDIIGPLGNGFPNPKDDFIAIIGGIGIASIFSLLEKSKGRAICFYGAREKDELLMLDKVKTLSKEIFISTDDGSLGKKSLITKLLDDFLIIKTNLPVYACGPMPMIKRLAEIVKKRKVKCYASLETQMACGFGVCLGCVIKTKGQDINAKSLFKMVCKEGPVFDLNNIRWE